MGKLWSSVKIHRRAFIAGVPALVGEIILEPYGYGVFTGGYGIIDYVSRRATHRPIEYVAEVIKAETGLDFFIAPKNNGGNRNLVIMQEIHRSTNYEQLGFFRRLDEKVRFDSFFFDGITSDPQDLEKSLDEIGRIYDINAELADSAVMKIHEYGEMGDVYGMETVGIFLDLERIRRIRGLIGEMDSNPGNPANKYRRQEIARHVRDMKYMRTGVSPEGIKENREDFEIGVISFQNEHRTPSMADNIDRRLKSYTTAGACIGFMHIRPDDFIPDSGYESILPYLDSKGISYLVMDAEHVAPRFRSFDLIR
ncbi:MAG: hypothetical protein JXC85_01980 [Candidatus Aenigmarchaeota archaeon]|nr:hypothetical protein [Candidatus Aenigmarchaeota archaeon]